MIQKATKFLFGFLFLAMTVAASPAFAEASLVGTTLKFMHVANKKNDYDASAAIFVEVLADTNATINLGRGYEINIQPDRLTLKFIDQKNWGTRYLFNGLLVDDVAWNDIPEQSIARTDVTTDVKNYSSKRITVDAHSFMYDLRGITTRPGDTLEFRIETK